MHQALYFHPLPVFRSGEQMPHAHPGSRHRQVALCDHAYLAPIDHRREISESRHPRDINQRARVEWKDWHRGNRHEDSSGRIVHEQRSLTRIDVGVVVSHHRPQVDGVPAPGIGGGKAVRLPCRGQQPQSARLDWRDLGPVQDTSSQQTQ